MLTFDKVLGAFREYLSADDSCEVLTTSRGQVVMDWDSGSSGWYSVRLCQTPEALRDVLLESFEEYQEYLATNGYKREITETDKHEVQKKCQAMLEKLQ